MAPTFAQTGSVKAFNSMNFRRISGLSFRYLLHYLLLQFFNEPGPMDLNGHGNLLAARHGPAYSLLESCSETDKLSKNDLRAPISVSYEYIHLNNCCFLSWHSISAGWPLKVLLSACQFQNRTWVKSLETCRNFEADFPL